MIGVSLNLNLAFSSYYYPARFSSGLAGRNSAEADSQTADPQSVTGASRQIVPQSAAPAVGQTGPLSAAQKAPDLPKMPGSSVISGSRTADVDSYECQTCKNRKYQDGSNDLGVSFKTPTHLDPERAAYAIRAHEYEHVAHAKAEAARDDKKEILSQSVVYQTAICPECGRVYMSGGTTRTTFRTSQDINPAPAEKGRFLDLAA